MNIVLVATARHESAVSSLKRRATPAIKYAERAFGRDPGSRLSRGRSILYNSNAIQGVWAAPSIIRSASSTLSFSQPPIPVDRSVSRADYPKHVSETIQEDRHESLLPNYFVAELMNDGTIVARSDIFGCARAYWIETESYVAVSNHVGLLAFLLDDTVSPDHEAWGLFSTFGWWAGHRSPLIGIKSLPAASRLTVGISGDCVVESHTDNTTHRGRRDALPDFENTMAQMRTAARNTQTLAHSTPRVFLSGGQDSRITAGAWLAADIPAKIHTYGTLQEEAATARELMQIWATSPNARQDQVTHTVSIPSPSTVTMSLSDRLSRAFRRWDADMAVNLIARNLPATPAPKSLSIGGMGGALMHGEAYQKEGALARINGMDSAFDHLRRVYSGINTPDEWMPAVSELIDVSEDVAQRLGHKGPTALDHFHLQEKYRRWPNSRLNSVSVLFLAAPAFVRLAFDLTPEQRLEKVGQRRLADAAVPGWGRVPYYKGTGREASAQFEKRGLRVWQRDSDELHTVIKERQHWPRYIREDRIDAFIEYVEAGQGLSVHDSWFLKCIMAETFPSHVSDLNGEIARSQNATSEQDALSFWCAGE